MIDSNTVAYRRRLPHLRRPDAVYFVTFCTVERRQLSAASRSIALAACTFEHERTCWLECAVIMPDHVHLVLSPFPEWSLQFIVSRIKSISARRISTGHVWQHESFDHILRSGERGRKKALYVVENPVRSGLAASPDQYPWVWRAWIEGRR